MSAFGYIKQLGKDSSQVVEVLNYKDMKKYAAKQVAINKFSEQLLYQLTTLSHPNITKIYDYEISDQNAYYLMELLNENSLYYYIYGRNLEIEAIIFYSAQVLLALQYLHQHNIVYRFLELQNLKLQKNGYIKLTNLDQSKLLQQGQKTYTICNSFSCPAPEILLGKGYNDAVDYWSFGVLLYQLAFGDVPFDGNSPYEIQQSIVKEEPIIPFHNSKSLQILIKRLLTKNPQKRRDKIESFETLLKEHQLFQNIDKEALYQQKILAPFHP